MVGNVLLSAAFRSYALASVRIWECWLFGLSALPLITPEMTTTLIGLALASPVVITQIIRARLQAEPVSA